MNKKIYVVSAMLILAGLACSALDEEPTLVPTKSGAARPTGAPIQPTKAGAATQPPAKGGLITVVDDTNAIQINVPAEWVEGSGKMTDLGANLPSARIVASTNLQGFYDYKAPGVEFIASGTLAKLGGYIQVLDLMRSSTMKECKLDQRYNYSDQFYEGAFDLFAACNGIQGQEYVVFSGRPVKNKFDHLVLLFINFTKIGTSEEKVALLRVLLDSFAVIGTLPK